MIDSCFKVVFAVLSSDLVMYFSMFSAVLCMFGLVRRFLTSDYSFN